MLIIMCLFLRRSASAGADMATGGNIWTKTLLVDVPFFLAASVSISAFYFCAQKQLHAQWWKRLLYVPVLMAVGIGLSINNARAVLEAVFNHRSDFIRTPKYGVRNSRDRWTRNKYYALRGLIPYLELAYGAYFSVVLVQAIDHEQWSLIPFVFIFQAGFLYVGLMSLFQNSFRMLRRNSEPELAAASA
jgi:hypothetical protein